MRYLKEMLKGIDALLNMNFWRQLGVVISCIIMSSFVEWLLNKLF